MSMGQLVRGRIKHTKTRRSVRAVPLQAAALAALDQLPDADCPLLFPAVRGGYCDTISVPATGAQRK